MAKSDACALRGVQLCEGPALKRLGQKNMAITSTSTRMLVVGGHTRSIGKTSLVVDLIRAFPEARWTAVKITQFGHGICSQNGESCGCAVDEHTVAIDSEIDPAGATDTSRFLAAGAARAFWLRTKQGRLAEGMPLLRSTLSDCDAAGDGQNAIIESNSLIQFLRPDLYLVVLDPAQADFKDTARAYLDRADAFVVRGSSDKSEFKAKLTSLPVWPGVAPTLLRDRPIFFHPLGHSVPLAVLSLVEDRFFRRAHVS